MDFSINNTQILTSADFKTAVKIKTKLTIPAYTQSGEGFCAKLVLEARKSEKLKITSCGTIASSLEKLLLRNIEILSSLKPAFAVLLSFHYQLISKEEGYRVKDVRSAGLPICLTLLNLLRIISDKNPNDSIVGTGVLRVDGSFETSSFEKIKEKISVIDPNKGDALEFTSNGLYHADFGSLDSGDKPGVREIAETMTEANKIAISKKIFINANSCRHVFDVESLLSN